MDWSFVRAGVPRPLQAFLVAFPGLGQSLPGPARILKGQGYGERAGLPGTGFRGILEFLEGLDGDVLVQVFPGLGQGCGHCGVVALLGEELGFLNDLLGEDRGVDAPCEGPGLFDGVRVQPEGVVPLPALGVVADHAGDVVVGRRLDLDVGASAAEAGARALPDDLSLFPVLYAHGGLLL